MMRGSVVSLLLLVGVGCGKKEAPPAPKPATVAPTVQATTKPAEPAEPVAKPVEPTEPVAKPAEPTKPAEPVAKPAEPAVTPRPKVTKAADLTPEQKREAAAKSKAFWALVNEGRGLVRKDKDYAGGIAKYDEALKIFANHPVALGESGYASLLAGDLETAERLTTLALAQQKNYRKRGALHYNLGQIQEKRGDPRAALNAYRSSYAARKNDTVKERIDTLKAQIGDKPRKTYKAMNAICDKIMEEWGCESTPEGASCNCGQRFVGPAENGVRKAALMTVTGQAGGSVDADYLVVEVAPDEWRLVGMVANRWSPGMFGMYNEAEVSGLELKELVAGQGAVLVAFTENGSVDSDMGFNAVTTSKQWGLIVCRATTDGVACLDVSLGGSGGVEKIDEDGDTPPEDEYGKLGITTWRLAASFESDGRVTLKVTEGTPPSERAGMVGTWTLDELAGLDGVAVTEL